MHGDRHIPTAGVICEFNPFHSGHAYLLGEARRVVGKDGCVICLMSGSAVQRGELAMADPYLRARTALTGGADLVLELPFPWSSGSAQHFATAGVDTLTRLGVDALIFGSESGNEIPLRQAAEAVTSPDFGAIYAELCGEGMGSAAAYAKAIRRLVSENCVLPDGFPAANDLLAINYLAAIRRLNSHLRPTVIRREGAGYHDDTLCAGVHPSATALRAIIREAACDSATLTLILEGTMPDEAVRLITEAVEREECPIDSTKIPALCHALFRLSDAEAWEGMAEMGGGVAGHMIRAAKATATPTAFTDALRTKQYTDARLRRAMLFALTGVTEDDLGAAPSYIPLLAANARGCNFLRDYRRAVKDDPSALPIVAKPADAPTGRQRALAERIDALFTLAYPHPKPSGEMMRKSPWVEKP